MREWKGSEGTFKKWDCPGAGQSLASCRQKVTLTSGSLIRCNKPVTSPSPISPPSRAPITLSAPRPAREGREPSKVPLHLGNNCGERARSPRQFVHSHQEPEEVCNGIKASCRRKKYCSHGTNRREGKEMETSNRRDCQPNIS